MGHDIYARDPAQSDADREKLHDDLGLANFDDDEWSQHYDEFRSLTEVAYLRRAMGQWQNKHIYLALNATDCNAGVSGSGESRTFSREQIASALVAIRLLDVTDGELHPDAAAMQDSILAQVVGAGLTVKTIAHEDRPAFGPELVFLTDIITWMDATGSETVLIEFG